MALVGCRIGEDGDLAWRVVDTSERQASVKRRPIGLVRWQRRGITPFEVATKLGSSTGMVGRHEAPRLAE